MFTSVSSLGVESPLRNWLSLLAIVLGFLVAAAIPPALLAQDASADVVDEEEDREDREDEEEIAPATPEEDLEEGEYEAAFEGFKKRLEKDANDLVARRGAAAALAAEGKYPEALELLKEAPQIAKDATLQVAAGKIELRRGRLKKAEEHFKAALAIDGANATALNRLGATYFKQGRRMEARKYWDRVIEVYQLMSFEDAEKASPEVFVEMGLALIGLNRFQEANSIMFEQAKEKDESNLALLVAEGRIFKEKYNYPDSRTALREALDLNPNFADALVELADNYLLDFQVGTNRYKLAEKNLDKALKVNPNHSKAYVVRGELWLSDGNIGEAIADGKRAIENDPSSLRAWGLLAACYYLRDAQKELAEAEEKALAVNPRGAEFFHTIALGIEKKFRYADCVRYCERALELDEKYWPAYVTLGINYLRVGDEKRGREFLDKSWEHDKFNVWVYNTRLLMKHMEKNFETHKSERFVFRYPRSEDNVLSTYLSPLMEDAFERLSKRYKIELKPPVFIEAFAKHKWFSARTVGLEGFAAAGACFGNLVTLTTPSALPQNWGSVSWHEFAHVVTLAATRHRIPRWFTEGLSVLEEGHFQPHWARNFAVDIADAYGSDRLLPISELDFGFSKPKYPNQILISYFQGCLIARYIIDTWSFDKILAMLDGYRDGKSTTTILREVFEKTPEEFDKGFFAYVDKWVKANGYQPRMVAEQIPILELEIENDPKNISKLTHLAWAYYCDGNEIDAPLTAQKVLDQQPANADAHAILGFVKLREKKTAKGKELLEKALKLGTRFKFRANSALGDIAAKAKRKDDAIRYYEAAREASPHAGATQPRGRNVYYKLAALYNDSGQEELAVKRLEELSPYAPDDPNCRVQIFKHYVQKRGEEALRKTFKALDELLYINPYENDFHTHLADTALKLGRHDVVIREYKYLLKVPGTNPKTANLALAKSYAATGKKEEAAKCARKVLEIDPGNREAEKILKESGKTE